MNIIPLRNLGSGVEAGACKSLPFAHDDIEDLAKARQLKSYDELISHVSGQIARKGFLCRFFFEKMMSVG